MNRSSLKDIVKGRSGAFDMPSIVTAVVIVGILTAGVLVTLFGIIPTVQDNGTKQDISAARTAEGVARAKDNRFLDTDGLVAAGYLPDTTVAAATSPAGETFQLVSSTTRKKVAAATNAAGTCYVAFGKSGTGKVFYGTDIVDQPQELTPSTDPGCITSDQTKALAAAVGGFSGVSAPASAPAPTGAVADASTASFSWNAVDGATGYRVEYRINGGTWTLQQDNQTATSATVAANGGDTVDVRVTARNAGGDSPSATATVKLPVPAVANGSFETGLAPWTGTGNTVLAAGTAHTGTKSAAMAYDGSSYVGTLSETAAIPDNAVSTLTFWYDASLTSSSSKFRFEVRDSTGTTTLATPLSKTGPLAATGWTQATVDMTQWRGQTVTLWAYAATYGDSYVHWDDFTIASAPPTVPAAPTLVGASGADSSATVTWAAAASPSTDVTGYTVTPYLDGAAQAPVRVDGKSTTATVTGLANGSSYTFTVTATNMAGSSPESAPSAAVVVGPTAIANGGFEAGLASWDAAKSVQVSTTAVHAGVRAAQIGNASGGDSQVSQQVAIPDNETSTLTFWYDSTGGSNSSLQVRVYSPTGGLLGTPFSKGLGSTGGWTQATVDLSSWHGQTITLGINQNYSTNLSSTFGPTLIDDVALTSAQPTAPAAPTAVGASAGDASATVSWAAAASSGTDVTGYTVTPYLNGAAQGQVQVDGKTTTAAVNGLTNGSTYTFTVTATNMAGTSPASAPTDPVYVTPMAIANGGFENGLASWGTATSVKTSTTAHSGVGAAQIGNASGGDSQVSQVVAIPDNATSTLTFWYSSAGGNNSTLQVRAYNSSNTLLGTPFNTALKATAGWVQATVDMTPYRGQNITLWIDQNYSTNLSSTFGPTLIDDVELTSVPPTAPAAPTAVGASAGDASATVTWNVASSPSTNITGYTVTPYLNGTDAQAPVQTGGTSTSATLTGLTNGSSYTFAVTATNMAGTSPAGTSAAVTPGPVAIANAGFEGGLAGWATGGGVSTVTDTVHDGTRAAMVTGNSSGSYVRQAVAVPDNATSTLTFWYNATLTYYSSDSFQLQVRDSSGNLLGTPFSKSYRLPSTGWLQAAVDLTPWRGQTVNVEAYVYSFATPGSASARAYLDDFALTAGPPTAPTAPTTVGASGGDKSATVTWAASSSLSTNLTGYTVTPYLNGTDAQAPVQVPATATTATVTGLTNGSSYTFAVTATNMAGTSPAGTSAAVTPGPVAIANGGFEAGMANWTPASTAQISTTTVHTGVRAALLGVSSGSGDSYVSQVIAVPDNATSTLTFWYNTTGTNGYNSLQVRAYSSTNALLGTPLKQTSTTTSGWTQATVDLTPYRGQTITLWIDQYNAGYSPATATYIDDLALTTTPATAPTAPTTVGASGGDKSATVTWAASSSPSTNLTGYTVTPYLNGTDAQAPVQVPATATTATVTGLTNGSSYTFAVTATNMAGTSPAGTSAAVIAGPVAIANGGFEAGMADWAPSPTAQISTTTVHTGVRAALLGVSSGSGDSDVSQVIAVPDNATSTLTFWYNTTGTNGYNSLQVRAYSSTNALLGTPLKQTSTTTSGWTQATVDLTPYRGQTITFWIDQYNAGYTPATATYIDDLALTTTPATAPTAPTQVSAGAGDASAIVTWTASSSPATNLTGYTVTPYLNGTDAQAPVQVPATATTATVTGLTNGSSYTFAVTATNMAGTSPAGTSAAVTPEAGQVAMANPGFESGLAGWTTGGGAKPTIDTTAFHSGSASVKLGNATSSDSNVSQTLTVPTTGTTTLSLWYSATNGEGSACTTSCPYDWMDFQVRSSTGSLLKQVYKGEATIGWTNLTADLTPYAGQTVTLWFNQHQDSSRVSWANLDDIAVTTTK